MKKEMTTIYFPDETAEHGNRKAIVRLEDVEYFNAILELVVEDTDKPISKMNKVELGEAATGYGKELDLSLTVKVLREQFTQIVQDNTTDE